MASQRNCHSTTIKYSFVDAGIAKGGQPFAGVRGCPRKTSFSLFARRRRRRANWERFEDDPVILQGHPQNILLSITSRSSIKSRNSTDVFSPPTTYTFKQRECRGQPSPC